MKWCLIWKKRKTTAESTDMVIISDIKNLRMDIDRIISELFEFCDWFICHMLFLFSMATQVNRIMPKPLRMIASLFHPGSTCVSVHSLLSYHILEYGSWIFIFFFSDCYINPHQMPQPVGWSFSLWQLENVIKWQHMPNSAGPFVDFLHKGLQDIFCGLLKRWLFALTF